MSIAQKIERYVDKIPEGQIFGYQALPRYEQSPAAVIKAISRLVQDRRLARLSNGKFYVPKKGILGEMKPSDSELIRSVLYDKNELKGYVTGSALYNQLGLTTQVPRTIEIAFDGGAQTKDFGTIRIKKIISRMPIRKGNVKLLQYLDVLKDIKKISDSDINLSLKIMRKRISDLSQEDQKKLTNLAKKYYGPQARALAGLILESLRAEFSDRLKKTLNPTTVFKLKIDSQDWAKAREWNIRP